MAFKCDTETAIVPLQIKPFVLRRTKDQVLSDLPPKIIQDIYVEPSPLQVHLRAKLLRYLLKSPLRKI